MLPDLRARAGEPSVIVSRTLRTWGESESGLNERLDPVIDDLEVAPATRRSPSSRAAGRASRCGSPPRVATADGAAEAPRGRSRSEIRAILGDQVFGVDDETMESVVLSSCCARGAWTLGLAESVTGGLVGAGSPTCRARARCSPARSSATRAR
jgi:nicotinamide-nucleotide amidase